MPLVARMAFVLGRGASESRWRAIAQTENPKGWYAIDLISNNRKKLPAWFNLEELRTARDAEELRPLEPALDTLLAGPRALSPAAQRDLADAWMRISEQADH